MLFKRLPAFSFGTGVQRALTREIVKKKTPQAVKEAFDAEERRLDALFPRTLEIKWKRAGCVRPSFFVFLCLFLYHSILFLSLSPVDRIHRSAFVDALFELDFKLTALLSHLRLTTFKELCPGLVADFAC